MVRLHRPVGLQNGWPDALFALIRPLRQLFTRTSLKFTLPALVLGSGAAILLATSDSSAGSGVPQDLTPAPATTHLTVTHNSSSGNGDLTTPPAQPAPPQSQAGNATSANVYSSVTQNGSSADVVVNGQSVAVPANGTVSKTITGPNGSTSVNVTTNNANGGGNSSSSLSVSTYSSSSSDSEYSHDSTGGN